MNSVGLAKLHASFLWKNNLFSLSFALSLVLFLHWPITFVMCYRVNFTDFYTMFMISIYAGAHTHQRETSERREMQRDWRQLLTDIIWDLTHQSTEITRFLLARGHETGERNTPILNSSRDDVTHVAFKRTSDSIWVR